MSRLLVAATAVAIALFGVGFGIGRWTAPADEREGDERSMVTGSLAERRAASVDCSDVELLDFWEAEAMLRAGPATRGIRCTVDGHEVHIFEMHFVGDSGRLDWSASLGFDPEQTPPQDAACTLWLSLGRGIAVVASHEATSEHLADVLGLETSLYANPIDYEVPPCEANPA